MNHHLLTPIALAVWSVLLALASVQLVAEARWRRRCARRQRLAQAAATAPEEP